MTHSRDWHAKPNTIHAEVLFGVYEARRKTTCPSLVYCGDDESGKTVAAELIHDAGFDPIDAGLYASRVTLSRSRCSWRNLHTRRKADPNWHIASSGLVVGQFKKLVHYRAV